MPTTYFRIDGWLSTPLGAAVAGGNVAVLTQPANFTTQPGSPLANVYASSSSNSASITGATWVAQQIEFTFNSVPADVVPLSYIAVTGASPSGYNSTIPAPWLVLSVIGNVVTVAAPTNPGSYVSGGTVATHVLPNPLTTDGNGHYFGYVLPGLYSLQVYYGTVELDYPDQEVGTVAAGVGTVTSVALSAPAQFTVAGSPVTTSGTLSLAWNTEAANLFLAGPTSGSPATPGFRALATADLPIGTGTVTSVALSVTAPAIFTESVSGSPITTNGTLGITLGLAPQSANFVWAGPTSGSAATPTFRALVAADLPGALAQWGVVTVAFSATPTFNMSGFTGFSITLTGNVTSSTLSGAVAGQFFVAKVIQDATGGRTFAWPANVIGAIGVSTTPNSVTTQILWFDGANAYAVAPGTIN